MPDWLDVDFVQTAVLILTAALAVYAAVKQGKERRAARRERRLELVAQRITELAAMATIQANNPGRTDDYLAARRNLMSALALAHARWNDFPLTRQLLSVAPNDMGRPVERALEEILAALTRRPDSVSKGASAERPPLSRAC